MEKRRFGRTAHLSTVAVFGAAAFWDVSQGQADATMQQVIAAGINHIDVAPSYGTAEVRLGPWLSRERDRFFLGCKTMERSRSGAEAELHRSLDRLQVESFDLYQIHAITNQEDLDQALADGGAIEFMQEARQQGLTKYIGITGHGLDVPRLFIQALDRFDFDSVLFPLNFIHYANPDYRADCERLLEICRDRDVGTMIIKSVARSPWGDRPHDYSTWYRPYDDPDMIRQAVHFVLSQDVTAICTPGDVNLLPAVISACESFTPLNHAEQQALVAAAHHSENLFPES